MSCDVFFEALTTSVDDGDNGESEDCGREHFNAFFAEFVNAHEKEHIKHFISHTTEVRNGEASPSLVWAVLAKFVAVKRVPEGSMLDARDRASILSAQLAWGYAIDENGGVSKERLVEFVDQTEQRMEKVRDNIVDILNGLDTDNSGTISVEELRESVLENPGIFLSLLGL